MEQILQYFQNNPILNLAFLILAILGVLSTTYFYFKSIRKKDPTFSIRSIVLMKDQIKKINELEIKYENEIIDNLAVSNIAFYNNGKETLKKMILQQLTH